MILKKLPSKRGMDMKEWRRSRPLFLLAGLLFGFKTYIVYRFLFDIHIDTLLQEIILFINPFFTSIIFFSLSIWLQQKEHQKRFILYSALFGSLIIYFNLIFYRSFTDFLTIPQLFQMSNLSDLSSSILSLIKWYDWLLFVDVFFIWTYCKHFDLTNYSRRRKMIISVMSLLLLSTNFFLAEMERPQLLQRAFDREYLVKNIGIFYYHIYDLFLNSKMHTQKVLADGNDVEEILQYITKKQEENEYDELYGIAKGKNVIFISLESVQSFVIEEELHGEKITPFLNRLVKDPNTIYFENFYHQTAQGKTSDSEFITENSLYPIASGAVFFTHGQNEYFSMSKMLKNNGYQSFVFHANSDTFWNRNQMYESLGIDHYYDVTYYELNESNQVGWGLKDKDFFKQTIPYLKELEQPFYAKLITLTNHFPFELEEDEMTLQPFQSNSDTLNNYFPTVRYTDEAIEMFFDELKSSGLYENSIIILMGDHDGISANHNKAMASFLDKEEITPFDHIQLQRVPLFIHIPGFNKGEVISKIGGQIDLKPTLLYLLGIEVDKDFSFGNNLFEDTDEKFIGFRNGNFVSDQYVYTNETCYDRNSGEVIAFDEHFNDDNPCQPLKEKVELELTYSDQIIYGDLFRFVDFRNQ